LSQKRTRRLSLAMSAMGQKQTRSPQQTVPIIYHINEGCGYCSPTTANALTFEAL
jgi:hypothetical protein